MIEAVFPFLTVLRQRPRPRFWGFWAVFMLLLTPLIWVTYLVLALCYAPVFALQTCRNWWQARDLQRRLQRTFPGQTAQAVLDAAPYVMGHNQGDGGYHVYDQREAGEPPILAHGLSGDQARTFILERMIKERP